MQSTAVFCCAYETAGTSKGEMDVDSDDGSLGGNEAQDNNEKSDSDSDDCDIDNAESGGGADKNARGKKRRRGKGAGMGAMPSAAENFFADL